MYNVHLNGMVHIICIKIDSVEFQEDLAILFDYQLNQLKFHSHTTEVAAKVHCLLGLIRRSFEHLDLDMLTKLFVTLVHHTLGYYNSVWRPSCALDQRKLDKVHTRLLLSIRDNPYGRDS